MKKPIFEFSYKWRLGMAGWVLHRLSGLALIFYLSLHIWVISHLAGGEEEFNQMMELLTTPLFRVLEVGLLGVILYHAFNGARVIFVDFFGGARYHKKLYWALIGIAALLFIAGAVPLLMHIF